MSQAAHVTSHSKKSDLNLPHRIATCAGLKYVSDNDPGYSRHGKPGSFYYKDPRGRKVTDSEVLERIRALVLPPAWEEVWICAHDNGHLQATGIDARGRKQYRYHAAWTQVRGQAKFERMLDFGRALPRIRQAVEEDLAKPDLSKQKVLAAVVRLLETTLIRVGNEEYAKTNESYGLTTMRNHHVTVRKCRLEFNFIGKSGKEHLIGLDNCTLASIVKNCRAVPGDLLFQYRTEAGGVGSITSTDVNRYLKKVSGRNFTAKDFRTWYGTLLAALALRQLNAPRSQTQANRNINETVKAVARELGNTPAVCRKCYIHPVVLEGYSIGELIRCRSISVNSTQMPLDGLRPPERALLKYLREQMKRQAS